MQEIYKRRSFPHASFSFSITDSPDPNGFERHCHSVFELIYFTSGAGKYCVESAEYPLKPGTVLILRPFEYHYVVPDPGVPYERCVINFSNLILPEAIASLPILDSRQIRSRGVFFPPATVTPHVRDQFDLLRSEEAFPGERIEETADSGAMIRMIVGEILLLLSRARPEESDEPHSDFIADVMGYLNRHLGEELTLEKIAHHFFVSKYYLCHAFRARIGVSVFEYLTAKRIAAAQQLIAGGLNTGDAAERVGFRDYSSFYRAYRKHTGTSPTAARGKG